MKIKARAHYGDIRDFLDVGDTVYLIYDNVIQELKITSFLV